MPRHRLKLAIILLSTLLFPLTLTGSSLALPDIRTDLGADLAATQWVVNGYNACFASFLVFTGSLADVVGRRRIFGLGLALFCGSGLLGVAISDIVVLNIARALAGVGAAAAVTAASALIAAMYSGPARVKAFGLLGTVLGAGFAFGPTVGGLLVNTWGWRAVFAVPAAMAGVVIVLLPLLPKAPGEAGRRIDWLGAALFTSALLSLIFALVEGPEQGMTNPPILAGFAVAAAATAGFIAVERRRRDPLFALELLANRRFRLLAVAAGSLVLVLVPLLVYLPSYFISVLGLSAAEAGLWLLMMTAPSVLLPSVGSMLAARLSMIWPVAASLIICGIGTVSLATIGPGSTAWQLAVPLLLIGSGVGLSTGVLDGLAIDTVPSPQAGTAAGLFNTSRLATETIGLAMVGAVLAALTHGRLAGAEYTGALQLVCLVLGGITAVAAACVIAMYRNSRTAVPVLAGR